MLHSEIQGQHWPEKGNGITLQDLLELLRRIPRQARDNYVMCDGKDVIGLNFSQSTQAEKWEFKVSLVTER